MKTEQSTKRKVQEKMDLMKESIPHVGINEIQVTDSEVRFETASGSSLSFLHAEGTRISELDLPSTEPHKEDIHRAIEEHFPVD